ncbi:YbaK/EbsC family protein [Lentibacter sp. XHP0401]|jgi:prolyl-tRNA editing enzyme YbaK/EbsC (Cys-tRNA(Pro) deacylase)|uniref:YbaK/EbsC family protein n=1 Tax=Lentibacter sp. XHP0401 TaxID=2984334 RepID=UPI0021E72489|nr:YbaK/EbsC family protein [Lentibacter sp. XHP0401]MCV2891500.1 YbaK/EbsC family protein [Lentibacter sp. XHP0401]
MSKSLKRVRATLEGEQTEIRETGEAKTALQAASELGVEVDQIAKSIIFQGQTSGEALLFITAGGNQVCEQKAAALAGEPLGRADAALVRAQTGFAIGGVSPIAHKNPIRSFFDPRLHDFALIWAAAGTPHHVFSLTPARLLEKSKSQLSDFVV